MTLRFESTGPTTFRVVDDIEHSQFELRTPAPVSPREAPPGRFRFPVDGAVAVETATLRLPKLTGMVVRGPDGRTVAQSSNRDGLSLPHDRYDLEVTTAPMKLYVAVESPLTVSYGAGETRLSFGSATDVAIGARSFHERPAGTVTTTGEPEAMMRAIATLGSSLQTHSPERSFPTLRGHPPFLELGEEFDVPATVDPPDTGLTLVLPPELPAVFAAAPLAYYLGADVVSGCDPRLAGDGWSHSLTVEGCLETGVARTLRRVFFLDCLTRTEGYYPVDLHERRTVESALALDFPALYDLPLDEQVGAYLDVPFDDLEPYLPTWTLTTDIQPRASNVEMLPFVANDLSLVRCPTATCAETVSAERDAVSDFFRSDPLPAGEFVRGGTAVDGASGEPRGSSSSTEIVEPDPVDTVEHAWVGDGYPLGASKATPTAYRRRLDRDAVERTSIEITVVCNDDEMREEDVVADLYGLRDLLQFDVEVHYDLTRDRLVEVLRSPTNFLHYIGHVDERGLQCADGFLDVTTLDGEVAVESFLLNACSSYEQGEALIDRGSYGGVVTLSEVPNRAATEFGRTLARLLNCGFTLRSALSIAQDDLVVGYRYIAMGDGGMTLCQAESGTPMLGRISDTATSGQIEIELDYYPSPIYGVGSIIIPYINEESVYYLAADTIDTFCVSVDELFSFLELEVIPVIIGDCLQWSDELDPDRFG
ncbi:hypothetical protein SAMN04487948_103122 [Halogranum amylolyticum]|uniref:CHAT domain-containing protein n=1 Tax=Halogranum amylolyticum TaxID=660520 RepID=A0A1H8QH15_9EURY|nr:hypothetical protein [Halogranum amylolyticum]SEO53502.1 hypothetical protein SAMN04487948_103122 [Halogranum amylolyticum]